ncbi:hypothetical protein FSP39_016389 [Pinctada imbricata]|uniref:Uncharacterized protein n=1 Tax=Pinctada imbricata TaxID=66713 RepID=A0AA88YKJ1_PINIB|nr:hypothetical protein FSP39_016389 [Pinctada imbricata]
MSGICQHGDLVVCIAHCIANKCVDKKLTEDKRKWVIFFAIRMWISYIVDALAVVLVWVKIGLPDWTDEYKVYIILYVCVVLCFVISLSVLAGIKWQSLADEYSPKLWRTLFVVFKTTNFIDVLFLYYLADFRTTYGTLTCIVAIIDMILCTFEILRVLCCFCDWCPCAYHADPRASCLCFNCTYCNKREEDYVSQRTQSC